MSVQTQTLPPDAIIIPSDIAGNGAAVTRQAGLELVDTEWTAFLDDDDEMLPVHLERLMSHALNTESDMVWSWFSAVGGSDPFPHFMGKPFDPENPHQTTITTLVRTKAARAVGGFLWSDQSEQFDPGLDADGNRGGEDFLFAIRMARAGYVLSPLAERTWLWHHDSNNTSGLATRRRGAPPVVYRPMPGPIVGGIS